MEGDFWRHEETRASNRPYRRKLLSEEADLAAVLFYRRAGLVRLSVGRNACQHRGATRRRDAAGPILRLENEDAERRNREVIDLCGRERSPGSMFYEQRPFVQVEVIAAQPPEGRSKLCLSQSLAGRTDIVRRAFCAMGAARTRSAPPLDGFEYVIAADCDKHFEEHSLPPVEHVTSMPRANGSQVSTAALPRSKPKIERRCEIGSFRAHALAAHA
nr:hypothetical protein [Caballeronia sp. NK8]